MSHSQYFYNIFTINHTWLIIISSKNLWQINCGNGITEKLSRTQYFYNIFIINHTWLIIISSKNFLFLSPHFCWISVTLLPKFSLSSICQLSWNSAYKTNYHWKWQYYAKRLSMVGVHPPLWEFFLLGGVKETGVFWLNIVIFNLN